MSWCDLVSCSVSSLVWIRVSMFGVGVDADADGGGEREEKEYRVGSLGDQQACGRRIEEASFRSDVI
jgi:hypothetical protein